MQAKTFKGRRTSNKGGSFGNNKKRSQGFNNKRRFSQSRNGGGRSKKFGKYIDPAKFVNKTVEQVKEEVFVPKHSFRDFGFISNIQKTLAEMGFSNPTPIQDGSIPYILEGKDVIGLADTGSGKTGAFLLPAIQKVLISKNKQNVLIVAPTRELADQIDKEFRKFRKGVKLFSALCVGGMNIYHQKKDLQKNPEFIIGTPGRLKDLINRGDLKLDNVSTFVLDEVDRMLDMGFVNDIEFITGKLPENRQTLCFSATTEGRVDKLLEKMLKDPVKVSVRKSNNGKHIEQDIIKARSKEQKIEILVDLLKKDEFSKVVIFGETKFGVDRLSNSLRDNNLRTDTIHGNKSQGQRRRALMNFKEGKCNILVATDVAARGIDIPDVTHVINFDQPQTYEEYIHRIGRTGRAGKKGMALTFVNVKG